MKNSWIISLIALVALIFFIVNYDSIFGLNIPIDEDLKTLKEKNDGNEKQFETTDFDNFYKNNESGIQLIEFSDFECPFCREASPYIKAILEEYNGKINYKFAHIGGHKYTIPAALAAECAREQDKFWAYHDKLFENQGSFSNSASKKYASELGLETYEFEECLTTKKHMKIIEDDLELAKKFEVTGTPTFVVDGEIAYLDNVPNKVKEIFEK